MKDSDVFLVIEMHGQKNYFSPVALLGFINRAMPVVPPVPGPNCSLRVSIQGVEHRIDYPIPHNNNRSQ